MDEDRLMTTWEAGGEGFGRIASATTPGWTGSRRKVNQDASGVAFGGPALASAVGGEERAGKTPRVVVTVCDGHGEEGEVVSGMVRRVVTASSALARSFEAGSGMSAESAFVSTADVVRRELGSNEAVMSGSTCIQVVLREDGQLVVTNLGDSRAVGAPRDRSLPAVDLSVDQKPDRPDELQRIRAMGGRVTQRRGDVPRVGGLALSRAFGDLAAHAAGVISVPESASFVASDLEFVVVASDGVWDMASSNDVVELVRGMVSAGSSPVDVASELVRRCRVAWLAETSGGYCDDVTAVVWMLPSSSSAPSSSRASNARPTTDVSRRSKL